MKTWTLVIAALAAATVLALAACGGSGGEEAAETVADETTAGETAAGETAAGEEQTDTSTTAGAEVKEGGILRMGTQDSIPNFNPFHLLTAMQGVALSMTYPQLVQFDWDDAKGYIPAPDFAESWESSEDGKTITFHTKAGAQWSDGTPLTAEDAAWTINTSLKFQDGPTGQMVPALEGMTGAEAVDETTLVVSYEQPVPNSPTLMAAALFPVLPKHIWEPQAEGDGTGMRRFRPELEPGGLVSGGPFLVKEYDKTGTTVFVPNEKYYGPAPHAEAVTVTSYTNPDALLQDLTAGNLEWVDSVPPTAAAVVENDPNLEVETGITGAQIDIWFNSNPRKPKHRELLDPRVKEALAMCIDRDELTEVVFNGFAQPVETMVGTIGGEAQNTDLGPRPYDCEAANQKLDELGYTRGSDGIRVVPATADEPEHKMEYDIITESDTQWNLARATEILSSDWDQLGVKVTQNVIGDETATWDYKVGSDCDPKTSTGYSDFDIEWGLSIPENDPLSTLSGELKESWCVWNFTGYDNPEYDALYQKALSTVDPEQRKDILWQMQEIYYNDLASVSLLEEVGISAHWKTWTGFVSNELTAYSKTFWTSPHQVG